MTKRAAAAALAAPVDADADELLAQIATSGAVLVVNEYSPATGRAEYLEQIVDVEAVKTLGVEEFLKQRYGGGRFLVRVRNHGKFGKGRVVPISGEPKPRETVSAAAATPAAPTSTMEKLLLAGAGAFFAALAPLLAKKLLEGPPPPPDRVDELLKLAQVLKPGGGADPVAQMTAMLTMMEKLREFQAELTPDAGGGGSRGRGGILDLVGDNLPRVLSILEHGLDRSGRVTRRLTAPVPAPGAGGGAAATNPAGTGGADRATVAGSTGADGGADADPLVAMLTALPIPSRAMLHQWAKADLDAEQYAGVVLDQLTDETFQAMAAELLAREPAAFVEVLVATIPAYAPQREWFLKLVVAMRAIVDGHVDDEAPLAPGGGAGHSDTSSPTAATA